MFIRTAAKTFYDITQSETLFRFDIAIGLVCYVFFLFLPLALYKLLASVNENMAKVMVVLALISVPIAFSNFQNKFAVLSLIHDSNYLKVFSPAQLQAQVLFYINKYDDGFLIEQIFSGLWLFPLGYLVFKSGFLPKILGIFLMLGCFGYLLDFFGKCLWQDYTSTWFSSYLILPASIGEIGICFWLMIMGVKDPV